MRFQQGVLTTSDYDHSTWPQATYEIIEDHIFTANDGNQNLGHTLKFSFRIQGDILTIHQVDGDDPWGGTFFEEAPLIRVS